MLFAAKHSKDRNFKLREDEITSCILGPLSYMPVNDVWNLFRAWLPFKDGLWPNEIPTNVEFAFWPNLTTEGRIEPDLMVRFYRNGEPMQYMLFEIKWDSPISGKDELVKQWEALSDKEKRITFHVYLVKHTGVGHRELKQSLSDFPMKLWRERLVCIGFLDVCRIFSISRQSEIFIQVVFLCYQWRSPKSKYLTSCRRRPTFP